MAIKRINPSRNAWDNDNRQNYGYVIRVPKLPDAHKFVKDFIVFNESDNCFYKCVEVLNETQHYFTWRAVTFGASRAYLIPVGKLTTTDINDATEGWTEKGFVACIPKTLNEIVFGMRRYHGVTHYPIGYVLATGVYQADRTYYRWEWNDTSDSIEMVLRKRFTGELKKFEDYTVGDPIDEETYMLTISTDPVTGEPNWEDITMIDMVAKANELIERLNQHEAGIPLADATKDINNLCKVINLIIEEVNPFCIPWQLLLNRQNFLELEVGQVQLDTDPERITPEIQMLRTNLAKWAEVQWECFYFTTADTTYQLGKTYYTRKLVDGGVIPHNYTYDKVVSPTIGAPVEDGTYEKYDMPTELLYGTVVQAVDAALNLIRYKDVTTGRLRDLSEFAIDTGDTLVAWLNRLKLKVDSFYQSIEDCKLSLKQIHDSIGEVGFVKTRDTSFQDTTPSTEWPGYYYWDVSRSLFILIKTEEYPTSKLIADWEATHPGLNVYQFYNEDIARTLIAKNAADILWNKQLVDNLLGTQLKRIYVEKLDQTGIVGSTYYYFDREEEVDDHPFIPFLWEEDMTLEDYQKEFNSPIFVPCTRNEFIVTTEKVARAGETYYYQNDDEEYIEISITAGGSLETYRATYGEVYVRKQTAAIQIRVNNEEIHRIGFNLFNYKIEVDEKIEEQAKRNRRLKQLTGVNGDDNDVTKWVVDGYVELSQVGQYREYRRYYKLDPTSTDPLRLIEMISGSETDYARGVKYILTVDEIFRAGVDYYTRTGNTEATYIYELATIEPGTAVKPKTYYNTANVDYVVPYYALTEDVQFQAGKTYYRVNEDGKFIPQIVTVGNPVDENTWYEFHNPTPRPASGVYIRKARKEHGGYEENNTHRGLIDRNTKDIEDHRQECGQFQKWTKQQLQAIEDFIFSLMLSTLDVITQERSTLSLLHETIGRLITLHNALERLQGNKTWKPADGNYDSGYDYYMKGVRERLPDAIVIGEIPGIEFNLTEDETFKSDKTYYTKCDSYYAVYDVPEEKIGTAIPANTYYEMSGGEEEAVISRTIKRWKGTGFFLTKDGFFVPGKSYYTRTGGGTTRNPYIYYEYVPTAEYTYTLFTGPMAKGTLPKPVYIDIDMTEDPKYYVECTTCEEVIELYEDHGWEPPEYDEETETYNFTEDFLCYNRDLISTPIPADTYFEYHDWYLMEPGVNYEVGLEVSQNVYTKDLVIATTENYTINEIRMAVNRTLNYHIESKELPTYTELPDTDIILESMKYYRYIDNDWEEIIPEVDDPTMIGKRIKDYDPSNKWYIKTGVPIPDGSDESKRYTETPVRMFLNELIKLHRRSSGTNNPMDLAAQLITGLGAMPTSSTYGTLPTILSRR